MAVSALYTGSAPSARHDGVELLGELVDERAASAEVLGRLGAGNGDDRRSRRPRLGLPGETTTALEALERRYDVRPRGRRRRRQPSGGVQPDRAHGAI